jgi:hypothetical protein
MVIMAQTPYGFEGILTHRFHDPQPAAHADRSSTLPLVIPTGAQRSGGTCGSLSPRFAQVGPRGVCLLDEPYFLFPSPSLDLLFPIDGITDALIAFEPDESIASVFFCETGNRRMSMFLHPAIDAIGHTAVENVRSAGDNINAVVVLSSAHLKVFSRCLSENCGSLHYATLCRKTFPRGIAGGEGEPQVPRLRSG